jgi:hypothetical protein
MMIGETRQRSHPRIAALPGNGRPDKYRLKFVDQDLFSATVRAKDGSAPVFS